MEKRKGANLAPPGPAKKMKSAIIFKAEYSRIYPCLRKGSDGDSSVFCQTCNSSFSCATGGKNDCKRHVEGGNHKRLSNIVGGQASIKAAMHKTNEEKKITLTSQIIRAESIMCHKIIACGNLAFRAADWLIPAFKLMFPDSDIAQGMYTLTDILLKWVL